MTFEPEKVPVEAGRSGVPRGLRVFAALLAALTYFVVVAGSAVTSTRSGLADTHWPTFGGSLLPSIEGMKEDRGLLFEHGHRMVAGSAVLLTWVLAILLARRGASRGVLLLAFGAAAAGLVPAVLGGLTVLFELPPEVSIAHVSAAMAFLSLNTALAVVLGKRWTVFSPPSPPRGGSDAESELERSGGLSPDDASFLARAAVFCAVALYAQAVLGALPRHLHGGEVPHILWAFAVFTGVVLLASRVLSKLTRVPGIPGPTLVLFLLVIVQFFLGFTAYVSRPAEAKAPGTGFYEVIASSHLAAGALMLVTSVVLALRALRLRRAAVAVHSPLPAPPEGGRHSPLPAPPEGGRHSPPPAPPEGGVGRLDAGALAAAGGAR